MREFSSLALSAISVLSTDAGVAQIATVRAVPPAQPTAGHAITYDSAQGRILQFGGSRRDASRTPWGGSSTDETWAWDGCWQRLRPANAPSARSDAALTWDSTRNVALLFGGTGNDETWTFDANGNWSQASPSTVPPARRVAALAFDAARGVAVLFGGSSSTTTFNDTWEWNGTDWAPRAPANAPPTELAAATFVPANSRVLLVNRLGQTWEWDGTDWTQRFPANALPAFTRIQGIVHDSLRARTVLVATPVVGGRLEVFEWDGANWTSVTPASQRPPNNRFGRLVFDPARAAALLVGGDSLGPFNFIAADAIAAWDGRDWVRLEPRTFPPPVHRHAAAYHAASDEVVMFGGAYRLGGTALDATWAFDGEGASKLRQPQTTPPARYDHEVARGIGAAGDLVMFGGRTSPGLGTPLGDTWSWTGTDWQNRSPAIAPSARYDHAMSRDATRGEIVLFGGRDASGNLLGDTWTYDGTIWRQRFPANPPPPLADHDMVDDVARGTVFMAGSAGMFEWDGIDWAQVSSTPLAPDAVLAYDSVFGQTYSWNRFEVGVRVGAAFNRARRIANPFSLAGLGGPYVFAFHEGAGRFIAHGGVLLGSANPAVTAANELSLVEVGPSARFDVIYGSGCAMAPQLTRRRTGTSTDGFPVVGASCEVALFGVSAATQVPIGWIGFTNANVRLDPIGMPGCVLRAQPVTPAFPFNLAPPGSATWSIPIPNRAGLIGLQFYVQAAVDLPMANPLGWVTTEAALAQIGMIVP